MSKPEVPTSVTALIPECGPELNRQLCNVIGEDFNPRSLLASLGRSSVFRTARGAMHHFTPNLDVRQAQNQILSSTYFSLACEPDTNEYQEQAGYRLKVHEESDGQYSDYALVEISPNALRSLYRPVHDILENLNPELSRTNLQDLSVEIAYKGIYSNVLTQYTVKRHTAEFTDESVVAKPEVIEKIDTLYDAHFGKDKIKAKEVRMNRLAMALGGAVMLRLTRDQIAARLSATDPRLVDLPLTLYAKGKQEARPRDEQEVSFSLAYAMKPKAAAEFMVRWFSDEQPVDRPNLRLINGK